MQWTQPLKKAGTYINIKDDKVKMFGQNINVCKSTYEHYAVEILPEKVCNFHSIEHCLIFDTDDDKKKKHPKLVKLHKQFGHASNDLKNLFKSAGLSFLDLLLCYQHSVTMLQWIFLVLIKIFGTCTQLTNSPDLVIILVVKAKSLLFLLRTFIKTDQYFGSGELVSEEFSDFCKIFNIKVSTTTAESPWSKELCEQHNAILTETFLRVRDDINCQLDIALAWTLNANFFSLMLVDLVPTNLCLGKM